MEFEKESYKLLLENRRKTDGYQYTLPSTTTYPYQWLWDSCFHAIVLSKLDLEGAKEELRSLVSKQFPNGMIPHIIYWQPGDLHKYEWGKDGTSAITQPPMIAYSVWKIYEKDKNKDFLQEMQEPMQRFYKYLVIERDRRDHHLVSIINPDESGEDNSPRFDSALEITDPQISLDDHLKKRLALIDDNRTCNFDAKNCMEKFFWVKDVPFNAILVENLKILEKISKILEDAETEKFCEENARLISQAMREKMLLDGIYWSIEGINYQKIKVDTWSHFIPLFAGLYTETEAERLLERYLLNENAFMSEHGIRTVSRIEPSYDPNGFWRGPIWSAVQWFIYKGLKRYGFTKEADIIKEKLIWLIKKEGFREYYNPETGEGMGAEGFSWGTLIIDMD